MTCQRQQDGGHKSRFSCVKRVPSVTLATLLSISSRRSRILGRGRAARSREARVEPESRSIQTHQADREESNSSVGQIHPKRSPVRMWTASREDQWRRAEAVRRLLGYLDYTHSPAASKYPERVKICSTFYPEKSRHGGFHGSTRQVSHFQTLCAADGFFFFLRALCFNWELEWVIGLLVLELYRCLINVFL